MAFVNPEILQKIFGGVQNVGQSINSASPDQQQAMIQMLAGAGSGMTQAANQPGANFAQALGGGAQGMVQGQMNAQQMQMNQMQMAQAKAEMERQERIGKIMGDILQPRRPDFASQVDARLPQVPQIGNVTATPYTGGPGAMTARYESGGDPTTVSTGRGDPGGPSYGVYQLSSDSGTMGKFLQSPEGQPFAAQFQGLEPGSEPFGQRFQQVASQSPEFAQAQRAYLERTHIQPVMAQAARAGLPVDNPAIQAALHSQATQHSGNGNIEIINEAMARLPEGAGPEAVLDALYDARERYATGTLQRSGASEDVIEGVQNRYRQERQETLGMLGERQVGGQAQPAAQAQQSQLNGYQQNALEQQANDPLAGLPAGTRQLLSLMEPEAAMKTLVDMQTGGGDIPARIQEAQMIAQQTGEPVGTVLARMRDIMGDGDDESSDEEDIRLFMEANPEATRAQAINAVTGDRYETFVDPLQGTMRRDKITGEVTPVRPEYGPVEFDPERDVPDLGDPNVQSALGVPGLGRNIANTVAGFFGTEELPAQEAERARSLLNNLATRATAAFSLQLPGRASNLQLEMGERLQVRPGQPTMSPARAREVFDASIRDMKAELDRINTDILDQPGYSSKVYSDARANASQIRRILGETVALRQALDADPAGGSAGPAPEGVDAEAWQFMTDEERALWQN